MKLRVSEQGVVIPREWLEGIEEVEIRKEDHHILVVPVAEADPILKLGENPVTSGLTDGAANHDAYLYNAGS